MTDFWMMMLIMLLIVPIVLFEMIICAKMIDWLDKWKFKRDKND